MAREILRLQLCRQVPSVFFLGGALRVLHSTPEFLIIVRHEPLCIDQKTHVLSVYPTGDDLIDDVLNKRFGAGQAFYGVKQSAEDKDYDAIAEEAKVLFASGHIQSCGCSNSKLPTDQNAAKNAGCLTGRGVCALVLVFRCGRAAVAPCLSVNM